MKIKIIAPYPTLETLFNLFNQLKLPDKHLKKLFLH